LFGRCSADGHSFEERVLPKGAGPLHLGTLWARPPQAGLVSMSPRAPIDDEDLIDHAVFDRLATGGEVFVTDVATLGTVTGVAATLRY